MSNWFPISPRKSLLSIFRSRFAFTFRFSAGIEAVRARCCFWAGTFGFATTGVLTSIVFRLKMFGDLLRVYLSRLSSLWREKEKLKTDSIWHSTSGRIRSRRLPWIHVTLSSKSFAHSEDQIWFKSIKEGKITRWIDAITWQTWFKNFAKSHENLYDNVRSAMCLPYIGKEKKGSKPKHIRVIPMKRNTER
jgi:hypothetical protein